MAATSLPSLNKSTKTDKDDSTTATSQNDDSKSTTDTSTKSDGSKMPSITSSSKGLPKLSSSTSSSSSFPTPTITPPSSHDNPNISRSSVPSGTVFIAVGAVAGFIFLSFILVLFIKKLIAKKNASKTLALDSESSSNYGGGGEKFNGGNAEFYSTTSNLKQSSVKIPLLYEQPNADSSMSDITGSFLKPEQNLYSTLDKDTSQQQNKRRSMFVSPTAEVMNFNKNKTHSRFLSTGAGSSHTRDHSNLNINDNSVPDLRHSRIESFDTNTDIRLTSPERSPPRAANRGHRTVPSQYLESMFED